MILNKTQKVIPLISRETTFGQHVRELVFGVSIFDVHLGFQVDSVKQPIKSNSVGSGYMSHGWTSAFDDQFNHCFVII